MFAAVVAIAAQQLSGDIEVGWLLALIAGSIPIGIGYGYLSWRFTRYRVTDEELRLDTGVLFRRSRHVRLDRLQAVDVVRPLVARALGLAELKLEVAGGPSSDAPLAYLSEKDAHVVRAELLARAAGLGRDTPEAPETRLLTVPLDRLIRSQLLSLGFLGASAVTLALLTAAVALGQWQLAGLSVPFALASVPAVVRAVVVHFDFTVAESPDGLRLRYGLLETRAQTVPPGRVQAVRVVQPLLWRRRGWARVEVNVAGYVGEGQALASTLLPVAPLDEALALLQRVLPGVEPRRVPLRGATRSARLLDPFAWRFLAAGADDRVFVAVRGRLRRETDIVLHERLQSARITQGVLQRRLGLATLRLDTTPGPVRPVAAHRRADEARAMLDDEVARARRSRAGAGPERWMQPAATPADRTVSQVTTTVDLVDPAFVEDPYPTFARLRSEAAVVWHPPTEQWLTLTYAAANQVLRDRRLGRIWTDKSPAERFEPFNVLHRNQMMENEPPDHTRLRSLVAKAFARGHVERLRPRVQQIADDLLDRAAAGGSGRLDVIRDYAEPLPVAVIAELLGVPEEDRGLLRPWSAAIVRMYEYGRPAGVEDDAVAASAEFAAYMHDLARRRRADPREDLVSHLAAVEDGGERLSADEMVASAILLLNAGHEASVNAFGNGMVALLRHPEQLLRLRADRSLVPSAVEEMIRHDAPLQLFERTAREDVEVGGVTIPAGGRVAALLGAANRDPAAFPDPDTFDIGRSPNQHIGFGAGLHHCLGAPLARMELQISLPTLLDRFRSMELADAPVRRPTFVLRGYASVPVRTAGSGTRTA